MTPYEMQQLNAKRGRIKWGSERPKKRKPEPSLINDDMTGMQIATFALIIYTVVLMAVCAGLLCVAMISWNL